MDNIERGGSNIKIKPHIKKLENARYNTRGRKKQKMITKGTKKD